MLRLLAGNVVSAVAFAALIQGPAFALTGRLDWVRGWVVVAAFFIASMVGGLYFLAVDPGLVRERAKPPRTQTGADALATLFIALCAIGFCAAAAFDSLRLQSLQAPLGVTMSAGVVVFGVGIGIVVWTFRVNSFATTIVEVQAARNQRVIETGPYRFVRHPMYFGAVWFFAGIALMLDSVAMGLAAVLVFPIAFLPRMLVEEAVLRRELAGYEAYVARVRSRILPGLF